MKNHMPEPKPEPKFCKDCKHVRREFFDVIISPFRPYRFAKCSLIAMEKNADANYLSEGHLHQDELQYSSIARKYNDMCGEKGKFWEAK